MTISAELVLEIDKLRSAAAESEARLRGIAATGVASAATMNRAFSLIRPVSARFAGVSGRREFGPGREAVDEMDRLRRNTVTVSSAGGAAIGVMGDLGRVTAGVAAAATAAGAAVAGIFAADSIRDAGVFQDTELQIARFAGGVRKAREILGQIQGLSVKTPFETRTLEAVTAGLLSAGVAADEVFASVVRLAKVAGDDEQLSGLGDALAKGFTLGKFDREQLNRFLERQINLIPALERVTGASGDTLNRMISDGKIGFSEMTAALDVLTQSGGQFFGLMEARSQTLPGLWSTLASNVQEVQRAFGAPFVGPMSDGLREIIDRQMPSLIRSAGAFGEAMASGLELAVAAFQEFGKVDWQPLWDDFLASGQATVQIFLRDLNQSLGKLATGPGSPFRAGENAGLGFRREQLDTAALGKELMANVQGFLGYGEAAAALRAEAAAIRGAADMAEGELARRKALGKFAPNLPDVIGSAVADPVQTAIDAGGAFHDTLRKAAESPEFGSGVGDDAIRQRFRSTVEGILDRLQARAEANISNRPDPLAQDVPQSSPARELPESVSGGSLDGGGAAGESSGAGDRDPVAERVTRREVPGTLQQMINRIAGRSAMELVAVESVRQTALLERVAGTLGRIETAMATPVVVETAGGGGRFSSR